MAQYTEPRAVTQQLQHRISSYSESQASRPGSVANLLLLSECPDLWSFVSACRHQWRTGPPGNREISRWAPASESFSGPRPYTRIYFIELTQSADRLGIQRTGHDVRSVSPSERMTAMYLIHSSAGYHLPESKIFLMRTKSHLAIFTTITAGPD